MNIYQNATVETLGESRKTSDAYTKYDYIELIVDGKIEQIRSVFVHDSVNAGLMVGLTADFVVGGYYEYDTFRRAKYVNECFVLRTAQVQRSSYDALISQLRNRPSLLGVIPWTLCMPIHGLRGASGGINQIGALILIFWVLIATPFVAPFTYFKRWKRHLELEARTKILLTNVEALRSPIKVSKEVRKALTQLS